MEVFFIQPWLISTLTPYVRTYIRDHIVLQKGITKNSQILLIILHTFSACMIPIYVVPLKQHNTNEFRHVPNVHKHVLLLQKKSLLKKRLLLLPPGSKRSFPSLPKMHLFSYSEGGGGTLVQYGHSCLLYHGMQFARIFHRWTRRCETASQKNKIKPNSPFVNKLIHVKVGRLAIPHFCAIYQFNPN